MNSAGACGSWRFRIAAIVDPQSLPRVAGLFAQRAIVPSAIRLRHSRHHISIEIIVAGLTADQATILAARFGEMVAVIDVKLTAHRADR